MSIDTVGRLSAFDITDDTVTHCEICKKVLIYPQPVIYVKNVHRDVVHILHEYCIKTLPRCSVCLKPFKLPDRECPELRNHPELRNGKWGHQLCLDGADADFHTRNHWKSFSEEQQRAFLRQNAEVEAWIRRQPDYVDIRDVHPSMLKRVTDSLAQRIWNWLRGVR